MRPVVRGDWPQINGNNIEFPEYGDARLHLINRIGDYCSYCENQITNPAVEHIHSKSTTPGVALNWYNFLLGCINCNSIKGSDPIAVDDYYWPDTHNTYLLCDFYPGGVIKLKAVLPAGVIVARAQETLNLVGLERYGSAASGADRRWIKRNETWNKAEVFLRYYENNGFPMNYIQSIVAAATSTGFWSVWMTVFEDHSIVQDELIFAFVGTYGRCLIHDINRV